jgi:hypothetical protein
MRKVFIVIISIALVTVVAFTSFGHLSDYEKALRNRDYLTKKVYNEVYKNDETKKLYDIPVYTNYKPGDNLKMYSIEVIEAWKFTFQFDFVMEPYFNNSIGDTFDILLLNCLFLTQAYSDLYLFEIRLMIFEYDNNIVGFTSGSSIFQDFSTGIIHSQQSWRASNWDDYVQIYSGYFISGNEIVHNYFPNDIMEYMFYSDNHIDYTVGITNHDAKENEPQIVVTSTVANNIVELDVTTIDIIKIIDSISVEKIIITGIVKSIDSSSGTIKIESDKYDYLIEVRHFTNFYSTSNLIIANFTIKVGDRVQFDFFKRYPTQEPRVINEVRNLYLI